MPEIILGLICSLVFVTLVGHGIWVVLARLFGDPSAKQKRAATSVQHSCPLCGRTPLPAERQCQCGLDPQTAHADELRQLASMLPTLERLRAVGSLDGPAFDNVMDAIAGRRRAIAQLVKPQPVAAALSPSQPPIIAAPLPPLMPASARIEAEPEVILDVIPVESATIEVDPPQVKPAAPRRSVAEVLAVFMEESNILWGELVGGLLIVGCSIALVVSLWTSLQAIPFFPFFVLAAITSGIFGAGLYSFHHWALQATSRALLIIASLLVPLTFLVLAGLVWQLGTDAYAQWRIGGEAIVLALFGWLLHAASRVLLPPSSAWLLLAVLGAAISQLAIVHLLPTAGDSDRLLLLGSLPVAASLLGSSGHYWKLPREGPDEPRGSVGLMLFVGIASFSLIVALGFLAYRSTEVGALATLGSISPLIALSGLPPVVAGSRLRKHPTAGIALAGVATAVTGSFGMLATVGLAWPRAWPLLAVCAINAGALTAIAVTGRLPLAHAPALASVALAYLASLYLVTHESTELVLSYLFSALAGLALTPLALFLLAIAAAFKSFARREDGQAYRIGAMAAGGASLLLTNLHGPEDPGRAAWLSALFAFGGLAAGLRTGRKLLVDGSLTLVVIASLWTLWWWTERVTAAWSTALACEAFLFALIASRSSGAASRSWLSAAGWTCILVLGTFIYALGRESYFWHAGTWLALAATAGLAAWINRRSSLVLAAQLAMSVAVLFGTLAALEYQEWHRASMELGMLDLRSAHLLGVGQAAIALTWVISRAWLQRRQPWLQATFPAFEHWLIAGMVLSQLGYAAWAVVPAAVSSLELARPLGHGWTAWLWLAVSAIGASSCLGGDSFKSACRGLVLLTLTASLLAVGPFIPNGTGHVALQATLAIGFIFCSIPAWRYRPFAEATQEIIWVSFCLPVLALSGDALVNQACGVWGFVLPLLLVSGGLIGYGFQNGSSRILFCSGLITTFAVTGGQAIHWIAAREPWTEKSFIILSQLVGLSAGLWAVAWIASRQWLPAAKVEAGSAAAAGAMKLQLGMSMLATWLPITAAFLALLIQPANPLAALGWVGALLGWCALFASAAAFGLHARFYQPEAMSRLPVLSCLAVGVLVACSVNRPEIRDPWLAYHVMMGIWLAALAWLTLAPPLPGRSNTSLGALVLLLSVRGTWADPLRPWLTAGPVLLLSVLAARRALLDRAKRDIYASAGLIQLAGFMAWVVWGNQTLLEATYVQVACLAFGGLIWRCLEGPRQARRATGLAYSGVAAWVATTLLDAIIAAQILSDRSNSFFGFASNWLAFTTLALAGLLVLSCSLPQAAYPLGLMTISLTLHRLIPDPGKLTRIGPIVLAGYVAFTAWVLTRRVRPSSWFQRSQLTLGGFVVLVSVCVSLAGGIQELLLSLVATVANSLQEQRWAAPVAVLILITALIRMGDASKPRWAELYRWLTAILGTVLLAELGWALLAPGGANPWLHRSIVLQAALVIMTVVTGIGITYVVEEANPWAKSFRKISSVLGCAAVAWQVVVVSQEAAAYRGVPVGRTALAAWAIVIVLAALAGSIASSLAFAVRAGADPLGWTEGKRSRYVYAAEVLLVLLFVHLRLTIPELFGGALGKYWTFLVMLIAFIGVGASEYFQRRGLSVLAQPLHRTGVFLPLLPLAAFWVKPPLALNRFAAEEFQGLQPLLKYLNDVEQQYDRYAILWLLSGLIYATIAFSRSSVAFGLLSALAANAAIWSLYYHTGIGFAAHPQLWLIPLSVILLVAEHVQRDRMPEPMRASVRYGALMMLYVSSTADMFLAGLGQSVVLPLVLALLSVAGVMLGILLRVRAFLYLGTIFLLVVLLAMIWHAAVDRRQMWIWWAAGIVLGALILGLFALFEKRRNDVLHVLHELRKWD